MAQRVTYRRRLSYNTKSNKTRVIKTPGKWISIKQDQVLVYYKASGRLLTYLHH